MTPKEIGEKIVELLNSLEQCYCIDVELAMCDLDGSDLHRLDKFFETYLVAKENIELDQSE